MPPKKAAKLALDAARKNASASSSSSDPDKDMPIFFYMPNDGSQYQIFCQWYPSPITVLNPSAHFAYLIEAREELDARSKSKSLSKTSSKSKGSGLASNDNNEEEEGEEEETEIPSMSSIIEETCYGGPLHFTCTEQYMMYSKALFFSSLPCARRILRTSDPKTQKQLGRSIPNFCEDEWSAVREAVGFHGNLLKFTPFEKTGLEEGSADGADGGNERDGLEMKRVLLETGEKTLCEAASKDRVWGIGFKEQEARRLFREGKTERWGLNLLGRALMRVRDRLRE
jgi:predicted NAD-dependent protein-ADP-ribosyltransferase YbiA (DUF1768 family)